MDSFANDALVPSCAHGQASSPAFQQAFYDASTAFVTDKDVDTYSRCSPTRRRWTRRRPRRFAAVSPERSPQFRDAAVALTPDPSPSSNGRGATATR